MRLDPSLANTQSLHFLGMAICSPVNTKRRRFCSSSAFVLVPNTDFTRAILASTLGHLGEIDEARRVWHELKKINPNYSFAEHIGRQPFKREEDKRRIAEGLEKAGLLS